MNYDSLTTEAVNARTASLDEMSAREIVAAMHECDMDVIRAMDAAQPAIARAVEAACAAISAGGRVFYIGAGTSGRLGVLDASECPPTFGVPADMFVGIIAGGDGALRRSVENAEDDPEAGAQALHEDGMRPGDLVVAISASGSAPYCLGALAAARQTGAVTAAIVCNSRSPMAAAADIPIEMVTGAEVLSGSTRLKAGTATKLALNMISTGAMALMGKTYQNLMVDVRATNKKLMDRCVRIVMRATGADRPEAQKLIASADGDLKRAIVMNLANVASDTARAALEASGGHVKRALASLK